MTPARVFAMARPARPEQERELVRGAVAGGTGSMAQRARRLAAEVARQALDDVDGDPGAIVIRLLGTLAISPVTALATDPDIDTAALIRAGRCRQLEARGGRRAREAEWRGEDMALLATVTDALTRRYQRHLCGFHP